MFAVEIGQLNRRRFRRWCQRGNHPGQVEHVEDDDAVLVEWTEKEVTLGNALDATVSDVVSGGAGFQRVTFIGERPRVDLATFLLSVQGFLMLLDRGHWVAAYIECVCHTIRLNICKTQHFFILFQLFSI